MLQSSVRAPVWSNSAPLASDCLLTGSGTPGTGRTGAEVSVRHERRGVGGRTRRDAGPRLAGGPRRATGELLPPADGRRGALPDRGRHHLAGDARGLPRVGPRLRFLPALAGQGPDLRVPRPAARPGPHRCGPGCGADRSRHRCAVGEGSRVCPAATRGFDDGKKTSDAKNVSSNEGQTGFSRGREGHGFAERDLVGQAADQPVEQVPLGGCVAVSCLTPAIVVSPGSVRVGHRGKGPHVADAGQSLVLDPAGHHRDALARRSGDGGGARVRLQTSGVGCPRRAWLAAALAGGLLCACDPAPHKPCQLQLVVFVNDTLPRLSYSSVPTAVDVTVMT